MLHYPDVPAASAWLCRAFGFAERLRIGSHRIQLAVADGAVVLAQSTFDDGPGHDSAHTMMVRVRDADRHHAIAVNGGASIVSEPRTEPYGERQYSAADPAGHEWTFSQSLTDTDPASWGGELLS